jgi:hypothetical protein
MVSHTSAAVVVVVVVVVVVALIVQYAPAMTAPSGLVLGPLAPHNLHNFGEELRYGYLLELVGQFRPLNAHGIPLRKD